MNNSAQGKLLVVDDNEMNRDMLSRRLKREGYTVTLAEDGNQAMELIKSQKFDLILLDIMMPGLSGFDMLPMIRETHSLADLPIIMATAKDESVDIVEGLKLGANDYVTKPIDFPVLLARLQIHLKLKALAQLKDEFLRIASHDLKNPLSTILMSAHIVRDKVPPGTEMPEQIHNVSVVVDICDSGPGLTKEELDRVFTKYSRLSNKPTGGESSSGLGLAICKQFIDLHGGKIGVSNNPDHGATFWFSIPVSSS